MYWLKLFVAKHQPVPKNFTLAIGTQHPYFAPMKHLLLLLFFPLACITAFSQQAQKPYGPLPTKGQLNWQETEMYCLIHWGPDTYTDKEWGYGDEDPKLVNPSKFSAMQIVGAAKAGGFKGIIVVAKHHDGFCLWPTKTTEHNITKSPYKNGKGDILREYREACDKLGMQMGVYCSPWDRNSALYGKPEYVTKVYREQLKELYSNYGPLFISWHDGANGGDGFYGGAREVRKIDRSTYYGWNETWGITRKMQPNAVLFGDVGPDVRWVGNERGIAGETSWATYTPHAPEEGKTPGNGFVKDYEGTEGHRDGKYWMPAECDVPLRPGWFYHADQDNKVKDAKALLTLYYQSVGRGAALDLGLAPNRDGQLSVFDVANLRQFGDLLKKTFAINLAKGAALAASNTRGKNKIKFGAQNLLDNDRYSYWATDDNATTPQLTLDLHSLKTFNVIRVRENIKLGQRIEEITVDAWIGGKWQQIAKATSIGGNRLIRLPEDVKTNKVRLRITKSPVAIALSDFGLYKEADFPPAVSKTEMNKIDQARANTTLFDTLNKAKLISKQFGFTEGPAVDKAGNIFFTDQPNNKIWKYDTDGKLSVFMDNAGRANGTYFDAKGNLIVCADEHNQLWSVSPDKKVTVLIKDFKGHLLNGPNDLWVHPGGNIYFTDPYYQRDYWTRTKPDLDNQKVFYLPKGTTEAIPLEDGLKRPNGIVGTPDGKMLYVADIGDNKIYKYNIESDGKISNRQVFISQRADGITLDERGNLYLAGNGITIYNAQGEKIGHIDIPEPWSANVCFGGKDRNELFITASKAIYVMKMNVKGVE